MAKDANLKQTNIDTLHAHQKNIAAKEAERDAAVHDRDEFIRAMLALNYSPTAIAKELGVTRGRIHQIGKE